jgi:hydroxymethylpyrimidine pyrophosphatase-like HAD family hydrolase
VAALRELEGRGALLCLATALPQRYARAKLPGLDNLCRRGVFLGGGQVLDEYTGYRHEVTLAADSTAGVLALLDAASPALQVLVQYGDEHHALRLPLPPELVATWGYDPGALRPYALAPGRPCTKIVAWHDDVDLRPAYEALRADVGERAAFYLSDRGHALQVTAPEATKGRGVARLLEHLGVDPSEAIAFGDGEPDADMFRRVGTAVAMGNAVPETRAAATWVTAGNDEDGVAVAVERLLENGTLDA